MKHYKRAEIMVEPFLEMADIITASVQEVGKDEEYIKTPADDIW